MISIAKVGDLAAEEIESIGTGFAARYYDALAGKPDASALRRFYSDKSKYVFAQPRLPDCEMRGLLLIGRFLKRMLFSECTVTVRSVATARRTHNPAELAVTSVCELTRPGCNAVPRTFIQSSVVKRVPWTTAEFQIVATEFRFTDDSVDPSVPIALGDKPKGSSAISAGTSDKLVNSSPVVAFDRRKAAAAGKPRVMNRGVAAAKPNDLCREWRKSTRAARSGPPEGYVNGQSSSRRRADSKLARGTPTTVPKKRVTGKPAIFPMTRPVVYNNALKDKSKRTNTQTTVNKAIGDKGRKDTSTARRTMAVRPACGRGTIFVSTNRYGSLAAVGKDCPSDVQDDHRARPSGGVPRETLDQGRSKKFKCNKSTAAESDATQNVGLQCPEVQRISLQIPSSANILMSTTSVDTTMDSRTIAKRCKNVASSERAVKSLAKRDGLIARNPAARSVGAAGDVGHRKVSIDEKKEKKIKMAVDTETVHYHLQDERPEVVHQAQTPKHRLIVLLVPTTTTSDQDVPNENRSKKRHRKKKTANATTVSSSHPKEGSHEVIMAEPYYS